MKKPKWNLEWNEGMSVGIPEIDADHHRFIALINELNRSIAERMKATEIHKRLQLLIEHTERHFSQEEKFLQEGRYPNAEAHASSHRLVSKTLKKIQDSFIPYGLEAEWLDAALIIKDILINHFIAEDMQYAEYFKSTITKDHQ